MDTFDVFLCHSSEDKQAVKLLAEALVSRDLRVWLDEWELVPGRPWQEAVENAISASRAIAVVLGPDGSQPWQKAELRAAISQFVETAQPVIPVLLPNALEAPQLPLFLRAFQWVDLRRGLTDAGIDTLEWGIRGRRRHHPSSLFVVAAEAVRPPSQAVTGNQSSVTRLPGERPRSLMRKSSNLMFIGATVALIFLLIGIAIGVWKVRESRQRDSSTNEEVSIPPVDLESVAPPSTTIPVSDSLFSRPKPGDRRRLETCGGKPLLTAVKIIESACTDVECDFGKLKRLDTDVDKSALLVALSSEELNSVFLFFEDGRSRIEDVLDRPSQLDRLASLRYSIDDPDNSIVFIIGKASSGGSEVHNRQISGERAKAVLDYLRKKNISCDYVRLGSLGASPLALSLADANLLGIPKDSFRGKQRILNQSVFVFVYPCRDIIQN